MENITLCGASWYEQKYYFNPAFDKLPKSVKDELQIMCVEFTEDVGGVLTLDQRASAEQRGAHGTAVPVLPSYCAGREALRI